MYTTLQVNALLECFSGYFNFQSLPNKVLMNIYFVTNIHLLVIIHIATRVLHIQKYNAMK